MTRETSGEWRQAVELGTLIVKTYRVPQKAC